MKLVRAGVHARSCPRARSRPASDPSSLQPALGTLSTARTSEQATFGLTMMEREEGRCVKARATWKGDFKWV
jgi:hypothetical protein